MGIRYEKDTLLNWINEMGKFLRLLVGKWESGLDDNLAEEIEKGYSEFFARERSFFVESSSEALQAYVEEHLQEEQIRPLALLLMQDGQVRKDTGLLRKAKSLLEYMMQRSGSFSFEDAGRLAELDRLIQSA